MNILIENTVYSFFIYILKEKEWEKSYFIFDISMFDKELADRLISNSVIVKKVYFNLIKSDYKLVKFKRIYFYYIEKLKYYYWAYKLLKKHSKKEIFGNDDLAISAPFRKCGINLIEDGIGNYNEKELMEVKKLKQKIKKFLILESPFYRSYGLSKNVKKIYLTGLAKIPNQIIQKVEIINLKKLWNEKSKVEQEKILEIFGVKKFFLNLDLSKKIVFLTQPLSEDNLMSLEEEIELYKKIFKNYNEKDLIIKPHPRENKDYQIYFPNIELLNKRFPFELFKLMEVKLNKIGTIFSTAVFDICQDVEIDFYGTKIHPKLLERFGDINFEELKN